jgi:hypothetical protein
VTSARAYAGISKVVLVDPCRDPFIRDRILIVTSHPWHTS